MYDLVTEYWWILIFSVPGVAVLIRLIARKADLEDSLSASLRRKLSAFQYSYPEHWVVTATTRDGRRFSRVVVSSRFRVESSATLPFKLRDLEDVAWEGCVDVVPGPIVRLSAGRSGAP